MLPKQKNDILKRFGRDVFERSVRIFNLGCVRRVEGHEQHLLCAVESESVKGQIYTQHIARNRPYIEGTCTCPVGYNCKHVAAALLLYLEKGAQSSVSSKEVTSVRLSPEEKGVKDQMEKWLSSTYGVGDEKKDKKKDLPFSQLVYCIKPPAESVGVILDHVSMTACRATFHPKANKYTSVKEVYSIDELLRGSRKNYIMHDDHSILTAFSSNHPGYWTPTVIGVHSVSHLSLLIERGKSFWGNVRPDARLHSGEPYTVDLFWQMNEKNYEQFIFCKPTNTEHSIDHIILLEKVCYVDLKNMTCGSIQVPGVPDDTLKQIFNIPHVKPSDTRTVEDQLQKAFGRHMAWPSLKQFSYEKDQKPIEPKPALKLYGKSYMAWKDRNYKTLGLIGLQFYYDDQVVDFHDKNKEITLIKDDKCYVLQRNIAEENRAFNELKEKLEYLDYLERWAENYRYRVPYQDIKCLTLFAEKYVGNEAFFKKEWEDFFAKHLDDLKEKGWEIELDQSFPYGPSVEPSDWFAEFLPVKEQSSESSGIEWFDLEFGVEVDGEKINLLPIISHLVKDGELLNEHRDGDYIRLPLPDGRRVLMQAERVENILNVLRDIYGAYKLKDGGLRISSADINYVRELTAATEALKVRWLGGQRLFDLADKLAESNGLEEIKLPKLLKATLREYQHTGLNWLAFLKKFNLGGLLADDMGLGKTIQMLAYIAHEHEEGRLTKPVLVVSPTSVIGNWKSEALKFVPHLSTLVIHGAKRHSLFDDLEQYNIIITTYPLILRDKEYWVKKDFHTIILDEAHAIKNPKTKVSLILSQVKADTRFCLTGTPIENHLGELWSIFNFTIPGFLETSKKFNEFYRNPIEKSNDKDRQQALVRRVKPFVLRRRKEEVVKELPPKTEIIKLCELSKSQSDLYETIRLSMQSRVQEEIQARGFGKSHLIVLDALLKLRQVCCDPRLIASAAAKRIQESAKLDVLREMVEELAEEGRRILIFSQFTSMLSLIEDELKKIKVSYVKLIGETKDRETPIKQFQAGEIPVFLISLKAGGVGLNLTAADTVIHYDPWWNPAAEDQATDRAHRIGQDKPIFVYKLIAEGTVEEKMLDLQQKKRAVAEGILGSSDKKATSLTSEDIMHLFA